MCRGLSRCLCSLSSAGDVCWAKPNHAFSDCQQLRSFFFQAGRRGVIALTDPSGASNDDDDGRDLAAPPTGISQTALFKGFDKTRRRWNAFDAAIASMRRGRDGRPSRVCEAPKKNLRRHPRFASHHPDLRESARTPTTPPRHCDDRRRRSRTSHRACRRHLRDARDANERWTCAAASEPRRRCSTARRERAGHRVANTPRHRCRPIAASTLTRPSPVATRLAWRKNKSGRTWRPVPVACDSRVVRERRTRISGLLLPAARRSRPDPAAR